jgi:hypothetical protein
MKRIIVYTVAILFMTGTTTAQGDTYYVNKDMHNGTGQDAYDFKIILGGAQNIIWHFDGYENDNHFDDFDWEVVDGNTVLDWNDPNPGPIPDCNWVHVGYEYTKNNGPAPVLLACWTDANGDPITGGDVNQPTPYFEREDPQDPCSGVNIIFTNDLETEETVTVENVYYTVYQQPLSLDQLNQQNAQLASDLSLVSGGAGPFVLGPGQSTQLSIPPVPYGYSVVIRFEGEEFVDFAQQTMGAPIPTVSQWGLIIMGLLMLAVGTTMIQRRLKPVRV